MISLQSLLSRYRSLPSARMARARAARVITEVSGVAVSEEEVVIQKNILFLRMDSAAKKHEILLHQAALHARFLQDPLTRSITRIS